MQKTRCHSGIQDASYYGFKYLNLCTDHVGYYEKFGFRYIGNCHHPWGKTTRIYQIKLLVDYNN